LNEETNMITRRTFTAGLASLTAAAATSSARAAAPSSEFRIGYQKSGLFVIARQRGAIEARLKTLGIDQVKWVEFPYGPPLLEALGVGSVDLGSVGDTPPIFAQAARANVAYVAATPASQSAILIPPTSDLKTLADLKGKKIGFARGSSSNNLTVQALKKAGLAYTDITPVYLTPADAAAAFAKGSIDAWTIWDPYFAIAEKNQKAKVLATSNDVFASNSFFLANKDFAAKQPDVLQAALDELRQVAHWANGHRDAIASALTEVTGVDIEASKAAAARQVFALNPITDEIVAKQQVIADTFHELGLIPRSITISEAVWHPSARS
jgi:sulfonate transport system substrate-binding protein